MTITWQQMATALLAALALHGGIAIWLALPTPELRPELPEQPLRVNLLAVIAETTTAAEPATPPPQQRVKPPITPKPKPVPKPVPAPVIQEPAPKPQPVIEPIQEPSSAESSTTPLDAAATVKYEQLLVAWLEKHKKYPRQAKRMGIEGEARLRILIDRTGQIQKVTLAQRTGNRLLDKAVLEMAERANPFPSMPKNDLRQTLEFVVPVVFALR